MFGHKRRTAIKQRAKLMGRMVMLLTDGLCTKSYDQFVESYSNPGDEPDETARNARISRFEMRFSPTCWYNTTASLAENAQPWIFIEGSGDDCGVFISVQVPADANVPSCPVVDLHVPRGAKRGHDAGAMVRALRDTPGWRGVAAIRTGIQHGACARRRGDRIGGLTLSGRCLLLANPGPRARSGMSPLSGA
jgi:hypothetical protein